MSAGAQGAAASAGGRRFASLRALVRIRPFRRLWLVLGLSALGDWLGLLASAAFASAQVTLPAAKGLAFGSVITVQLLPALLLGPVAGVLADRFDRRYTMATVDLIRFGLYFSIPVAALVRPGATAVAWAAIALFIIQAAALLWVPAKEAAVPNLVPHRLLESANQLTLVTTYGVTPVIGALVFAGLARLPDITGRVGAAGLALWFDALTFLASALVVLLGIREISGRTDRPRRRSGRGMFGQMVAGARFIMTTPFVRGVVFGILGAFAGAGVVVGTARFYAQSLGGGDASFGILFAALFTGFGIGVGLGPRIVGELSRRRWFATSIIMAGAAVAVLALIPRLAPAALAASVTGAGAGMAFLAGITLLGGEVADDKRGRVFAFVETGARVTLIAAIAVSSVLVGAGSSRRLHLFDGASLAISTTRVLLFVAGIGGVWLGRGVLRQIDDRRGISLLADVWNNLRRKPTTQPRTPGRSGGGR